MEKQGRQEGFSFFAYLAVIKTMSAVGSLLLLAK